MIEKSKSQLRFVDLQVFFIKFELEQTNTTLELGLKKLLILKKNSLTFHFIKVSEILAKKKTY